jgi:diguanylate cyclase (GGDEF)-like protein/PAS domain S-box-containing protein
MSKKDGSVREGGGGRDPYGHWFTLTAEVARLEAMVAIQQEVATSTASLPTLMTLVTTRAQELTGASGAVIEMPEEANLVYRVATGSACSHLGARIPQQGTLAGRAFLSGQALLCEDARSDDRVDRATCQRMGVRSMIGVGLVSLQRSHGVLIVLSPDPRAFTEQHVQTLRLIGGILAARLDLASELAAKQSLLAENTIALAALRESESRFRRAFDDSAIGMALVALDGRWLKVNPALCRITGYLEEELLGLTFQAITHPDDLGDDLEFVRRLLSGEITTYEMEKRYLHKNGSVVWILLTGSTVSGSSGQPMYFISQIQDITDRKRAHAALIALATRDELTGLYNRREMDRMLAEEIVRGRRLGRPVSLLLIDLDHFKQVNDTFGHQVGDAVLRQVAQIIGESVRSFDRVARYGGEEFAVILPEAAAREATIVAERIRVRLADHPVEIDPRSESSARLAVTVSVGIGCTALTHELTPEQLLGSADRALYDAKKAGRNRSILSDGSAEALAEA